VSGELLVTLDEAGRRLALCRRTLQQLVYDGCLPSVKVRRARRIALVDLEAYVAGLREANDRGTASLAVVGGGGQGRGLTHAE
jgi:excisionase family DNA binding protein